MNNALDWTAKAWSDCIYWHTQDKKNLKRINKLLDDTMRYPFEGLSKPEPLKNDLLGLWSKIIDDSNRLIYKFNNNHLTIIACKYHYDKTH